MGNGDSVCVPGRGPALPRLAKHLLSPCQQDGRQEALCVTGPRYQWHEMEPPGESEPYDVRWEAAWRRKTHSGPPRATDLSTLLFCSSSALHGFTVTTQTSERAPACPLSFIHVHLSAHVEHIWGIEAARKGRRSSQPDGKD